ncbi:tripartite tricarboxylate transporter TctB family protein [Glutamicibacter sp. MNS18]|uniref:tripartite tricarboxylate transporter TctB family protein n=1 Tax=Glutamicibacter sp. MNS18 TaxID=2989817 RepID=UPI002235E7FF|nr:tripartite tricarboxylate transporter TctB family protein [Glutamicibacter sp. MNS18]MCW4465236.1 tripartite tricarboxylate transporter TctB family protein [Glutamicibacter sp. MNS18]
MLGTRKKPGETAFAFLFILIGLGGIVGARSIRVSELETGIGPRAFPYLISAALLLVGIGLVIQALRGQGGEVEEGEDVDAGAKPDWVTIGKIVGFVVLFVLLLETIGWPLASTLLFGGCAWALGAKPWWRGVLIGFIVGLVIQFLFGGLLGVSLPAGPVLENVRWLNG